MKLSAPVVASLLVSFVACAKNAAPVVETLAPTASTAPDAAAVAPDVAAAAPDVAADVAAASAEVVAAVAIPVAAALPEAEPPSVPQLAAPDAATQVMTTLEAVRLDAAQYASDGVLRVYADLRDATGRAMAVPQGTLFKLYVDDREVAAEATISTFAASNEPIALGLVLPMHVSYTAEDELPDGSKFVVARAAAAGLAALAAAAPPGSKVAAWRIDAAGLTELAPFGTDATLVARRIVGQPLPDQHAQMAPALYEALAAIVGAFESAAATLPSRRVLVVVHDGKDREEAKADKRIRAIVERAMALGLFVDVRGLTLDMPEPLVSLQALAVGAGGAYREIPFEALKALSSEIADIGRAIGVQLVIAIRPKGPLPTTGRYRFELTSADGQTSVKRVLDTVQVPARK